MKILVVQDTDWVRRGPHQQHHVFERLQDRGHEVRVIDFPLLWRSEGRRGIRRGEETMTVPPKVGKTPIRVTRPAFWQLRLLDLVTYRRSVRTLVTSVIDEWRPDVVVGHGLLADAAAARVAARRRLPYVAHWLDALDALVEPPWARPVARRLARRNLRAARRCVAIAKKLGDYMKRLGAPPQRVQTIPAGVDVAVMARSDLREATRRRLGIGPGQVALLWTGWLYRFCGVDAVADAVTTGSSDLVLLVVGEGDLAPRLQALAERHPARVKLLGQRPFAEIPGFLAAADACLLPHARNPTMEHIVPIKVYEYLAAGRPVYATRLPGLEREFGESPGLRWVSAARDIPRAVVEDGVRPGLTDARAGSIRAVVAQQSWENVVHRWEALLAASSEEA